MKAYEMKLIDLNCYQRREFYRRIIPVTPGGFLKRVHNDYNFKNKSEMTLGDAFPFAGVFGHSAKIQSKKVMDFQVFRDWQLFGKTKDGIEINNGSALSCFSIDATDLDIWGRLQKKLNKHALDNNMDPEDLYWVEYNQEGREL